MATCNNHGKPKTRSASSIQDFSCECDAGYGGKFCDYCKDPSFAYPDCSASISSSIYDSSAVHAFLSRRKYEGEHGYATSAAKYFPAGALEPTVFNEECGWVDFPDDLYRVELGIEFSGSELHIADMYVVNHRQDNIMKVVPRSAGVLKILV